jgi:hypothetical protein
VNAHYSTIIVGDALRGLKGIVGFESQNQEGQRASVIQQQGATNLY